MKKPYERALTLEELAQVPDEDIDLSEIPELTEEFFKNARWVGPQERKQQMTIRFDADIVERFRAQGKGC
jgi:uncharacterized protein (DUF4415 family)